jgi:hypothetical protein
LRKGQHRTQFADSQFVLLEREQDPPARGIGERCESVVYVGGSSHIR